MLDRQRATQNWKLRTYYGDRRQFLSLCFFKKNSKTGLLTTNYIYKQKKNCNKISLFQALKKSECDDYNQYAEANAALILYRLRPKRKSSSFPSSSSSRAHVALPESEHQTSLSLSLSCVFTTVTQCWSHGLSPKVRFPRIGHEVHCFNFPSLQVLRRRGKKKKLLLKCCQMTRVPLLEAVQEETHNLLPATPPSYTLTFVPLPFHL